MEIGNLHNFSIWFKKWKLHDNFDGNFKIWVFVVRNFGFLFYYSKLCVLRKQCEYIYSITNKV